MQNLVTVAHTVSLHCRRFKKLGVTVAPPLGWGERDWILRNTHLPTCYHTKLGRSRSNRMGLPRVPNSGATLGPALGTGRGWPREKMPLPTYVLPCQP